MLKISPKITKDNPKIQAFGVGDMVDISYKMQEDEKERIQHFQGIVISLRGEGQNQTFTVRRIGAQGIGVERIFPLLSPAIAEVKVKKAGSVRRAKLYYLRERIGRSAMHVKAKA